MNTYVKKQDIGGIKKISAEDIQNSFFNEGLEDEYKSQALLKKKSNSRERFVKQLINESEGPNFSKLYSLMSRMTEEEFVILESVVRDRMLNEATTETNSIQSVLSRYIQSKGIKDSNSIKRLSSLFYFLVRTVSGLEIKTFSEPDWFSVTKSIKTRFGLKIMKKEGLKRYSKIFTEASFSDEMKERLKEQILKTIKSKKSITVNELYDLLQNKKGFDENAFNEIVIQLSASKEIEQNEGIYTNQGLMEIDSPKAKSFIDSMTKAYGKIYKPNIVTILKSK